MKFRSTTWFARILALWVGVGVLSAGFLAQLPELHAELHHHHHDHEGHDHDHDDHDQPDHQCLIQCLSDGGLESAAAPVEFFIGSSSSAQLLVLEARTLPGYASFLLPPGRAPPSV